MGQEKLILRGAKEDGRRGGEGRRERGHDGEDITPKCENAQAGAAVIAVNEMRPSLNRALEVPDTTPSGE